MKEKEEESSKKINLEKSKTQKSENPEESASKQISKIKQSLKDTKEDAENKFEDIKKSVSEKTDDIKEEKGNLSDEAKRKKNKLIVETKYKDDFNPAEKVVGDVITKFKQGAEQINEMMTEYTKENKSKKKVEKPLVDVFDTNENVIIVADINGVKKEDISVEISKNCVEIEVKYVDEPDIEDAKFILNERSYGTVTRKIPFKSEINVRNADAKFGESKLTVTLPKKHRDITKLDIN